MRNSAKIVTAVAVAGLAFASGSAFTGTGLGNSAPATQFIGGTVSQSVTGATLAGVNYAFADADAKTQVKTITLAFTDTADGHAVAVAPTGASGGTFNCGAVASNASECTYIPTAAGEPGYVGLTGLAVTVS